MNILLFHIFPQQSALELLVYLRELPFLLCANLQLPQAADLGSEIGTAHGHIQGTNLLQLPCARLHRDLPAASEGSAAKVQGIIPGFGIRNAQ